jgi:ribosomal protein S18 acetylase RimI-like enzyme
MQEGDEVIGGLDGSTSYGWLHVKVLWVDPRYRRQGHGQRLMEIAEAKVRERGCHGVWLDTSSPEALALYASLGFTVFGEISNAPGLHPSMHRRWFLKAEFGHRYQTA